MTAASDTDGSSGSGPAGPPPGRYGSRERNGPGRRTRWLLFAVTLVIMLALSMVAYNNLGSPPIEGKAAAFDLLDDESVRIRLEVRRDNPDQAAVCVVRARGLSGREVGRKEVFVPAGESTTYQSTVLTASAKPVTGEVFGCSHEVPSYLPDSTRPSG